ncbi:MAG: hypothetical protein M1833_005894 [Piccolia ochrophora]|nr:MAG: hypothetical protein M1833_005894 [Piccolia ochrophora]
MQAFVPKSRRPKFELFLKILDLNNVPLVSGSSYIKWHIAGSTTAEHRGRTGKAVIKDHKVTWDYNKTLPVRLTVDKHSMLQESYIHFEVLQEYSLGSRAERIMLGGVKLNLAEYVESGDGEGEDITRRYLMQESKINSTLKVSICMKQVEGDRSFVAPPLRTAPAFGGIAGIMSTESTEPNDAGHISAISSKSRDHGESQDMYRRTLAASWAAQAGELPADECIEDLFAGGSGWRSQSPGTPGHAHAQSPSSHAHGHGHTRSGSAGGGGGPGTATATGASSLLAAEQPRAAGNESLRHGYRHHKARLSGQALLPTNTRNPLGKGKTSGGSGGEGQATSSTTTSGQTSAGGGGGGAVAGDGGNGEQGQTSSSGTDGEGRTRRTLQEVDEFDVRDDLRSWTLQGAVG